MEKILQVLLDPVVLTPILTIGLGWITLWVSGKFKNYFDRKKLLRNQEEVVLGQMLSLWLKKLANEKEFDLTKWGSDMEETSRNFVTWASNNVIIQFAKFLKAKYPEMDKLEEHEIYLGKMIIAFRKQIGFRNWRWRIKEKDVIIIYKAGHKLPI